ncbi:unnamed protein product [Allacma fusca]|uniref:Uncharacterized protein n=1 Tax=Allacma fusca TaxID=39272 RepID=A0A8J2L560_9HEXA|nr:unnamed protein product [Allacma fusca]
MPKDPTGVPHFYGNHHGRCNLVGLHKVNLRFSEVKRVIGVQWWSTDTDGVDQEVPLAFEPERMRTAWSKMAATWEKQCCCWTWDRGAI